EQRSELWTNDTIGIAIGDRGEILVGGWILGGECRADRLQLGARLLEGHAIGEPADDAVAPRLPRETGNGRWQRPDRHPYVGLVGKVHAFRHHADDGGWSAIETDGPSDDRRV